jgi:hypothetical protein
LQEPPLQLAELTFASRVQSLPQAPQLVGRVRSTSQPLLLVSSQFARSASQTRLQRPPSQLEDATFASPAQGLPQPPQDVGSSKSASQPSATFPLQSPRPSLQLSMRQAPVEQLVLEFAAKHGRPHSPQSLIVRMSTSQPLAISPSQSFQPSSQLPIAQPSGRQVGVACGRFSQRRLHRPQLSVVVRSVSQALLASPSQSARLTPQV